MMIAHTLAVSSFSSTHFPHQFIRDFKFERMGCFAYSEEDGTPAAGYEGQVPLKIRCQ